MDLPIEIFLSFIAFSMVMGIVGLWKKVPFLMFIAGGLITFWAITTDNIQVESFSNGGSEDIVVYPQDAFTGVSDVCGNGGVGCNDIRGEYVFSTSSMLYGDTIDCMDLALRKTGAPTGDATVGVYDRASATNNPILQEFGSIDTASLNSGFSVWYTFCLPVGMTYTIGDQDLLGLRYDAGNATNAVRLNVVTADNFDSTNTRYSSKSDATNVWTDTTTSDLTARFYLRGSQSEIVYDTLVFTEYPKILFGIMASIFMIAGALIWKLDDN